MDTVNDGTHHSLAWFVLKLVQRHFPRVRVDTENLEARQQENDIIQNRHYHLYNNNSHNYNRWFCTVTLHQALPPNTPSAVDSYSPRGKCST